MSIMNVLNFSAILMAAGISFLAGLFLGAGLMLVAKVEVISHNMDDDEEDFV